MSEPSGIGILALQGGVVEHRQHLAALGGAAREVRTVEALAGLRGLILPGGESTCLGRLLKLTGLGPAIVRAFREEDGFLENARRVGLDQGRKVIRSYPVPVSGQLGRRRTRAEREEYGQAGELPRSADSAHSTT